jgi:hypothetical protein
VLRQGIALSACKGSSEDSVGESQQLYKRGVDSTEDKVGTGEKTSSQCPLYT